MSCGKKMKQLSTSRRKRLGKTGILPCCSVVTGLSGRSLDGLEAFFIVVLVLL